MPDRAVLERCCRLAKKTNARIVTSVFQGDTADEGVCRAMTADWVYAGLQGSADQGAWGRFHAKADTTETGKANSDYGLLQNCQSVAFEHASGLNTEKEKMRLVVERAEAEIKLSEMEESDVNRAPEEYAGKKIGS
jgi:hypothetical protein